MPSGPQSPPRSSADIELDGMTVLQVLPALQSGGVERGTVDVAHAIAAAGGRPLVASAGGGMVRELTRAGIPHIELPVDRKGFFQIRRNTNLLADLIRTHQVDIVHARSRAPAWSARTAARRTRRAFITTFHGTYNFRTTLKKRYNAIMTRGDRVIAISDFIARHIQDVYKVDPARLVRIHRGVDETIFDPAAVPAPRMIQLAEDWRLPDDAPVVMLPGRLTRWKGQMVFLEALRRMSRQDFAAVIVGGAHGREAYEAELKKFANQHNLHAVVRFVDHCNDMPAAYKLADIVVSASTDPEAFGRVAVEAQAMGRPVIASDHGASRETVIEGKTGWLTPPGDAGALARTLEQAIDMDAATRERMATAARDNVCQNFTKDLMCLSTLGVYLDVMRGR